MLSAFHESSESYNERDSLKTMNEDEENEYKEKEDKESNESEEEEEIILYCTKNEEWDVYFLERRVECQTHRDSIVYLVTKRRRSKKWERKKELWKLINPRRLISLINSSWYWSSDWSDWVSDTRSWHYFFSFSD